MLLHSNDFSIKHSPLPWWTMCQPIDPGWLYILKNGDLLKIGKTTDPKRRLREARTWLPNGEVIGTKPFWHIHEFERTLLCGIANFWHEGEWHRFPDESWSDVLTEGFRIFDDHDHSKTRLISIIGLVVQEWAKSLWSRTIDGYLYVDFSMKSVPAKQDRVDKGAKPPAHDLNSACSSAWASLRSSIVMAGLVPAIHDLIWLAEDVDARHKAGHDG